MKKLALSRETLVPLTSDALIAVNGGIVETDSPTERNNRTLLPGVLQPAPQPQRQWPTATVLGLGKAQ